MPLLRLYNGRFFSRLVASKQLALGTLLSPPRLFSSQAGEDFNFEILNALKEQNKLLQKVTEQKNLIRHGTKLLRSIDARLGRLENGGVLCAAPKRNKRGMVCGSHRREITKKTFGGRATEKRGNHENSNLKRVLEFVEGSWIFLNAKSDSRMYNCLYGHILSGTVLTKNNAPKKTKGTVHLNWRHMSVLAFNESSELMLESGVYNLRIRYGRSSTAGQEHTGIVLGGIEFRSDGYVGAKGADWDRLLSGQRQLGLPYSHGARGELTWLQGKISESWKDGDEITFTIDTNRNSVTFQRNDLPKKVLKNVLAFTNNRVFPEYLRAYAYSFIVVPEGPNDFVPPSILTILPNLN